jgi:hypothetical protein
MGKKVRGGGEGISRLQQIQYRVMPTELIKLHTYSQQHIHNRTRTICYSMEKMSLAPATPEKIHEKCMTSRQGLWQV